MAGSRASERGAANTLPQREGKIRHLVRIDGWLQALFSEVGNAAIPEIPAQPNLQMWVIIGALRTERCVEITLGLAIAEPAGHDPGLRACERVNFGIGSRKACLGHVAGGARVAWRIRQCAVVKHRFPQLLDGSQLHGIPRQAR
jgi:hypothetical protein